MQKRILAGSLCTLALAILADSSIQDFTFTGWVQAGEPEFFKKDSLFGYIDGGAEIFLQSGFVDLSVSRYRLSEKTSPRVKAVHWISPTQASLVKGSFYINISGQDCTENDIEVFAAAVSEKIKASAELPAQLSLPLPEGRIQGTERYIMPPAIISSSAKAAEKHSSSWASPI